MIDGLWLREAVQAASRVGGSRAPVDRLQTMLANWAVEFSAVRADVGSPDLTQPRRGLHPDEARTFLTALDADQIAVDQAGFVTLTQVRPKTPPRRYALLCKNGPGVGVNLEYIIQIGTACELTRERHWPPRAIDFERGEFDALGYGTDERVILAVEAKARVAGQDSLETLARAWMTYAQEEHPDLASNAGRKYAQLRQFCQTGPVVVWLVAAGARWPLLAVEQLGRIDLSHIDDVTYERTRELTRVESRQVLDVRPYDPALHRPGTLAAAGQCSWFCSEPAIFTIRVREVGGSESTFGLCADHAVRVQEVYGG